jgi:hypothetical protein
MDRAALDPVVLNTVEQTIGLGAQFSLTYATQVHPGQDAQTLHYVYAPVAAPDWLAEVSDSAEGWRE